MPGNTDSIAQRASREASGWMVRLQEVPEDAELLQQFNVWLADPINGAAWAETQRMTRVVAGATPSHAESWGPFLRKVRAGSENQAASADGRSWHGLPSADREITDVAQPFAPDRRMNRRRALGLVGLAAAASIAAVVVGPELALNLQADYVTATAESLSLRLADDSIVVVAPGSAIAVTYTPTERRVRLLAGEIYLEVTPNAERPFRVLADDVQVTVLGTAFNVSRSDDGAEVGVAHGVVRVDRGDDTRPVAESLKAGEFVRIGRSGRTSRGQQPASQVGAWRQSQLIAQDQPLRDVVDRLRRYYPGVIIVTDASLFDQPVTGVYNLGNPVSALRGVARSQNAIVREITPWLLIVSRS